MADSDNDDTPAEIKEPTVDERGYLIGGASTTRKLQARENPLQLKLAAEKARKEAAAKKEARAAKIAARAANFGGKVASGSTGASDSQSGKGDEEKRSRVPEVAKPKIDSRVSAMMQSGIAGKATNLKPKRGRARSPAAGRSASAAASPAGSMDDASRNATPTVESLTGTKRGADDSSSSDSSDSDSKARAKARAKSAAPRTTATARPGSSLRPATATGTAGSAAGAAGTLPTAAQPKPATGDVRRIGSSRVQDLHLDQQPEAATRPESRRVPSTASNDLNAPVTAGAAGHLEGGSTKPPPAGPPSMPPLPASEPAGSGHSENGSAGAGEGGAPGLSQADEEWSDEEVSLAPAGTAGGGGGDGAAPDIHMRPASVSPAPPLSSDGQGHGHGHGHSHEHRGRTRTRTGSKSIQLAVIAPGAMKYTDVLKRKQDILAVAPANTTLDAYLLELEFKRVFELTRGEFSGLPDWMQTNLRKKTKLFHKSSVPNGSAPITSE